MIIWETLLQPLCIDFFGLTIPYIPVQLFSWQPSQFPFIIFAVRTREQGEMRSAHELTRIPNHTNPKKWRPPSLTYQWSPFKVRFMPRRAIPHWHAPLEEYLPCATRKFLSTKSPCSHFDIGNFKKEILLQTHDRDGWRYKPTTITETISVGLVVPRGGRAPPRQTTIMVISYLANSFKRYGI